MSDHYHSEYAGQRHEHREYADERHDHDNEYAGRHHRHFDLERDVESLRALLEQWRADLRDALERIRVLEDLQPDYADPEADDDEPGARDEELSPVLCLRVIETSNGPRQCRLPVDHEPDAACPGNPHARPAQDDFVQDRHADLDPNADEAEDYLTPDGAL